MVDSLKISEDIAACKAHIKNLKTEFNLRAVPVDEKERIQELLQHLYDIDQYIRQYIVEKSPGFFGKDIDPFTHKYKLPPGFAGDEQERALLEAIIPVWQRIDQECTKKLKELLKSREWFTVSEFGADADKNAWLITQHADLDPAFQKKILTVLEKLYPIGETLPRNYAFLYDRVACSPYDPSKRKPQRYGTQITDYHGEIEDPKHLNQRRKKMGLKPLRKD